MIYLIGWILAIGGLIGIFITGNLVLVVATTNGLILLTLEHISNELGDKLDAMQKTLPLLRRRPAHTHGTGSPSMLLATATTMEAIAGQDGVARRDQY